MIAALYTASSIFLIRQFGWVRRFVRVIFFIAAITVLAGSGSRGAVASAVALSVLVLCLPVVSRWLVQAVTLLAAISPLVLSSVIAAIQFIVNPLMSLAPGRKSDAKSIATLENRDYIWDHAIRYWIDWVNDLPHLLFGYGATGQYRSGASLSYSDVLSGIIRHPELAYVHNSFLQQLFDGGLVGWLLLTLAAYWAGTRFSRHRHDWGVTPIVVLAVLLLGAMTEASMAPGLAELNFWLFLVLVGIACQASGTQVVDSSSQRPAVANSGDLKGGTGLVSNRYQYQSRTRADEMSDSARIERGRMLVPVRAGEAGDVTKQDQD
jgi:hypothetical protein